jgi:acyl-CoA synthetase (AMP-forming)/AMP-acid ligase II
MTEPTETTLSLAQLLRRQVERHPRTLAVIDADRSLTYRDLNNRAGQFANALAANGIAPGERVAYLAKNRAEFFEILFGAAKRRAVALPLNFRLHPRETVQILNDAGAAVLIVGPEFADQLDEIRAGVQTVRRYLVLGDDPVCGYEPWLNDQPTEAAEEPATPDGLALLFYTSGTTGTPKGVMLCDANWNCTLRSHEAPYAIGPAGSQLFVLPLFHIGGLLFGMLAVAAGATTILMADANPARMIRLAHEHKITHLPVVPVLLQAILELLDSPEYREVDLSSLETVIYGATTMPEPILRAAIDALGEVRFFSGYGMTETCASISFMLPDDHDLTQKGAPQRLRSVGRRNPEMQVRIVHPETLEELSTGEAGEIVVQGDQVMLGYWNRPEETATATTPDGWLRTGDGGYLDEDGYLFLTDRVKDMVITGGENVYPAEVERVLIEMPGVREVAVIGVPDERWGETPKAVIVAAADADLSEPEVIGYCHDRLARYKCPTSVEWTDELPRTPSGKVMKHVLRNRYARPGKGSS